MIVVSTFNGTPINDGVTYVAGLPGEGDAFARSANPIVLDVIGGFPRYEGNNPQAIQFPVEIELLLPTKANIDALNRLFRVGGQGEFVVIWDGETRVRDCAVLSFHPMSGSVNKYIVMLLAADPRWRKAVKSTQAGSIVASGTSFTVHQNGNAIDDKPVIRITPVTQKTAPNSWLYRRYAVVANRVARALTDWPIDITNYISTGPSGGLDHATLFGAGKSQANGNDLRVLLDGIEIPRYIGENAATDPNSARTTIWATPIFSAALTAHLYGAITNVSPANGGELEVLRGEVRPWPKQGYLLNPTSGEVIAYSGWTEANANGRAAFTGITRARFGTTAASGSANDTLYRVERKIELIYGHTGIAAPEARPDVKPILDLTSATISNIRHEWINFYDDLNPARPGQWVRRFEPRDLGAGFIYVPQAPATPAPNLNFEYDWTSIPTAKDNFNVVRRSLPVGTDGASGHFAFTRVVDTTMMIVPLGVALDGVERMLDRTLSGPLTSATYTAAAGNKLYELAFYGRSSIEASVPESEFTPLPVGATEFFQVAAVNANSGAFQKVTNNTSEPWIINKLYVMISEPTTPVRAVDISIYADNGSGSPNTGYRLFGPYSISGGAITGGGQWLGGGFANYLVIMPGQTVHVEVITSGTGSNVVWYRSGDKLSYRFQGVGAIDEGAHGAHGDGATIDNVVTKFDTAAVPYFALNAEAACYWLNGTLTNTTTQQSIRFNLFVSPNDQIEIDVGARTVKNLTTGETGLLYGLDPSDDEAWLSIVPGDNVIQWTETGCQRVDFAVDYFDRWE